jgi:hypothetical protein
LLSRFKQESPFAYATAGGVAGLLFWPLLVTPFTWLDDIPSGIVPDDVAPLALLLVTSAYGVVCAILWWIVARRQRAKKKVH